MLSSRIRFRGGLGLSIAPRARTPVRSSLGSTQQGGRRSLYLAPPFLLDDYTPRYQLLSSVDAAKKRSQAYGHLRNCNLCPRECGVNRYETTGMCLIGAETVAGKQLSASFYLFLGTP